MSNPEHALENQRGYVGKPASAEKAEVSQPLTGWTKLFHPRGPQVTLPVPCNDYRAAFEAVSLALDAGWLVQAPGLEEGEEKETVGWVLRGGFEKDGKLTPFVLLYSANEALTWSFLKVYLNSPEDVAAFEYAAKLKLAQLPDYEGNDKPQRGASAKTDKYIVGVPRPFQVVFKKNPKHDDTEQGKMKPARLFVRWVDQKPAGQTEEPAPQASAKQQLQREVAELLAAQGKTVAGLMCWLRVPDPHGTALGELTVEQLQAAKGKLRQATKVA